MSTLTERSDDIALDGACPSAISTESLPEVVSTVAVKSGRIDVVLVTRRVEECLSIADVETVARALVGYGATVRLRIVRASAAGICEQVSFTLATTDGHYVVDGVRLSAREVAGLVIGAWRGLAR